MIFHNRNIPLMCSKFMYYHNMLLRLEKIIYNIILFYYIMIKKLIPTGGNSSAIVLPKAFTKKYDLNPSDYVILEEKNGVIILKKLLLGD